ncbi:MAG: hypothetical protein CSA39_05355 [Flavobacteriales bacterium]|nr:MAG: hypothetical protein CSA39_05355 [Flavobacteriales bacterium]
MYVKITFNKQVLGIKSIAIAALFILTSLTARPQQLEQKIPASASVVISYNAKNVMELMPEEEWNAMALFQELFKELKRDNKNINSLSGFGLDLNSKFYYAMETTDSISYHNFYLPVKDRVKLENLFDERDKKEFRQEGEKTTFSERDFSVTWNDQYMIFTGANTSYNYMNKNKDRLLNGKDENEWWTVKREVTEDWLQGYAKNLWSETQNSILSNKRYITSKDKNAVMSLWVNDYGKLFSGLYKEVYAMVPHLYLNDKSDYGVENLSGHWYFEKDNIRMKFNITYNNTLAKSLRRIYKNRLNSNLYSYVDIDNAISYLGMSFNTENAMEEYPKIIKQIYGGMLSGFTDEIEIITDLYDIIIDEKEIANLFPGDGLLVLTDLREKDIEYTSYEYDEDYNQKEIKKNKKELRPDLILLIETNREGLFNKALKIAGKYKFAELTDNLFQIKIPDFDESDIFALVKDGMVAIATDKKDLQHLVSKKKFDISSNHRKFLRRNPFSFYINSDVLVDKLEPRIESENDKKMFQEFVDLFDGASMHYSRMKGNDLMLEVKVNTNPAKKNSMTTLLDFIDQLFITFQKGSK